MQAGSRGGRTRYMYWYPACPACRPRRAEQSAISPFLELALKTAVSGSPEALLHLISTFRSPCSPRGCPACAEGRRLRRRLCLRDRRSGPDAVGESAACMPKLEPRLAGRSEILRGPMLLCELQALRAAKRTFQLSKGTKTLACCGGPHQPLLRRAHSLALGLRVCILEIIKGGKDRPPSLEQQPAAICARDPAVLLDRTAVMQTQWSAAACNICHGFSMRAPYCSHILEQVHPSAVARRVTHSRFGPPPQPRPKDPRFPRRTKSSISGTIFLVIAGSSWVLAGFLLDSSRQYYGVTPTRPDSISLQQKPGRFFFRLVSDLGAPSPAWWPTRPVEESSLFSMPWRNDSSES